MEQHGRAHRGPAQTWSCPDGRIHVLDAGDSRFDKMKGFSPERGLKAVRDMAGNLSLDTYRDLAGVPIEPLRLIGHPCGRERVGQDLDQRNEMRRVKGMPQNKPGRIFPTALHLAERETRGGRGHDRIRFQHWLDLCEERLFDLDTLWHIFLNEVSICYSLRGAPVKREPTRRAGLYQSQGVESGP